MDKFTKVVKTQSQIEETKDKDILFQNDYLTVKSKNDWTYVTEKDMVVALPYARDEGYVYLRAEQVPPWSDDKNDIDSMTYLTLISGTIEDGETPAQTLRRELYEEAGIAMSQFYNFNIEGPYYISKGSTTKMYVCLMDMNYTDFKVVAAPGDGTKHEDSAQSLRVSVSDLSEIKINDMVTIMLIEKMKKLYNLR